MKTIHKEGVDSENVIESLCIDKHTARDSPLEIKKKMLKITEKISYKIFVTTFF